MPFLDDALRDAILSRSAVVWAGAGVSAATSGGAPLATWTGLVQFALNRCTDLELLSPERARDLQTRAQAGISSLVGVCNVVESELRRAGEWEPFWFDFQQELIARDATLAVALADLSVPLVTTNYDGLLEAVTGRRSTTWQHPEQIERVMDGRVADIVHVHGVYDLPDTIVFSGNAYRRYRRDARVRATLKALQILRPHVYVGFGAGLRDPFFRAHFRWLRSTIPSTTIRHFRLCTEAEKAALRREQTTDGLVLVAYGRHHGDLPGFVQRLKQRPPAASRRGAVVSAMTAAALLAVAVPTHVVSDASVTVHGRAFLGDRPVPGAIVMTAAGAAPIQADAAGEFRLQLPRRGPTTVVVAYGARKVPFRIHLSPGMREVSIDLALDTAEVGITRLK